MAVNDRFLRALKCQPVDRTPVWLMRQAGRYLPEYRKLRAQAGDFLTLCKTPELACEVTLQPLQRFDFDAAILFSDILTIPDAMGLGLYFTEGEGPCFYSPVRTEADIKKLTVPDYQKLRYVYDAVSLCKQALKDKVPLIGFSGSPWTLATYMVEGGASKNFSLIKKMLYSEPALLHQLLKVTADAVVEYLQAQIAAGVQAVMIFDTWGGILTTPAYMEFSLGYMSQIVRQVKQTSDVPIILFTKGGGLWLEKIADSGCNAIGLDWTIDIGEARRRVPPHIALQGNMDPGVLYGSAEKIECEVKNILTKYGRQPGHIFNLGHGITPDVPFENVKILVDAVHNFSFSQNVHN